MTEEIIIDGVNVVGCEFFNDCECKLYKQEYWERTDTTFDFCKEHPLCEYKATAILERLEQENRELKKKLELDEVQLKSYFIGEEKICKENNTYRSALEEIRVIINQPCDNCKYNKDGITCSIGDCGEGKLKIIENKIEEVLGD